MPQLHRRMLPIGQLMIEHRLMEHMINLFRVELDRIGEFDRVDPDFIDASVGFMRDYADICHHGKEERILFARLAEKSMSPEHKKIMEDLIQEHVLMRKLANDLVGANERYVQQKPGSVADIIAGINNITELYPRHIEKEDKHFFVPAMGYFTDGEKEDMLNMFLEFDSRLFHDEYAALVASLEEEWRVKLRKVK